MTITIFDQDEENLDDITSEDHFLYEVFCADGAVTVDKEDGLVWKEVLREGEWAYRPGPGQKPIPVPLKVVAGHASEKGQIGMADLIEAFNDEAIDHVTVPTSHEDKPDENTGYVEALKMGDGSQGRKSLLAGIKFTEPDIEGKAKRGSIPNTSVGVLFDYIKKETGKKYNQALGHVALTGKPWINGMKPFGVAASENYSDDEIVPLMLASVVWNTQKSYSWLRNEVSKQLRNTDNTLFVDDIASNKALVTKIDQNGSTLDNFIVPFKVNSENVTLADPDNWIKANQEWVKASQSEMKNFSENFDRADSPEEDQTLSESAETGADNEKTQKRSKENMGEKEKKDDTGNTPSSPAPESTVLSEEVINELRSEFDEKNTNLSDENVDLRKKVHALEVEKEVEQLKTDLGEEQPGLLKEVQNIMLADTGKTVLTLTLSEEGKEDKEVELSATQVVKRVLNALPKKDGKFLLGEQHVSTDDHDKPDNDVKTDLSDKERADDFVEDLGLSDEYQTTKQDGDE